MAAKHGWREPRARLTGYRSLSLLRGLVTPQASQHALPLCRPENDRLWDAKVQREITRHEGYLSRLKATPFMERAEQVLIASEMSAVFVVGLRHDSQEAQEAQEAQLVCRSKKRS